MILLLRDSLLWEEKEGSPWPDVRTWNYRKGLEQAFWRFRLLPCMLELLVGKLKVAAEMFCYSMNMWPVATWHLVTLCVQVVRVQARFSVWRSPTYRRNVNQHIMGWVGCTASFVNQCAIAGKIWHIYIQIISHVDYCISFTYYYELWWKISARKQLAKEVSDTTCCAHMVWPYFGDIRPI